MSEAKGAKTRWYGIRDHLMFRPFNMADQRFA